MHPRKKSFVTTAAVFVGVVVLGSGAIWAATGRISWALRFVALVVVVALALLIRGLGKATGRALKHTPCAHCGRQILFEHEAEICAQCDAGLHARCVDEHRSKAHAAGPFR
jgi:hypothetical protein